MYTLYSRDNLHKRQINKKRLDMDHWNMQDPTAERVYTHTHPLQ